VTIVPTEAMLVATARGTITPLVVVGLSISLHLLVDRVLLLPIYLLALVIIVALILLILQLLK